MKTRLFGLVITLAFGLSTSAFAHSKSEFHDAMRALWEDHAAWTRMYIISAAAGLPDTNAVAQRLLQNQADIGNAVADFYGRAGADKLTSLLRDHILIAADLVQASKVGDTAKAADAQKRWVKNADDIAAFLHSANPQNWPTATLQDALHKHLDQTAAEATHQLKGQYDLSIKDYGEIVNHMLMIADILSSGIEKQFAAKFDRD